MINTFVGNLGHFFVILAFVSAIIAVFGYFKATNSTNLSLEKLDNLDNSNVNDNVTKSWFKFSRTAFYVHSGAVLSIIGALFYIIYAHKYEYFYAYDHSSNQLPVYYMISCFWEGQEGSFLLWIFWNVLLGLILIKTNKTWEAPVMTIFATVQLFLVSMILGVVFFDTLKIGSSPFILTRDVLDIPVYNPILKGIYNPNFVPTDGQGLNLLLQNYWMVIHPPTLFLGFALTLVPFAFAMAGLWQKRLTEWIRPALAWSLLGCTILGVGILMGAYWAYETLNFGGYWNWDPVENAVYVPWLVQVGAIHTLLTGRKSFASLKTAIILTVTTFLLILYSTFLTRSGVLGNGSVHSFTDLGLSGQLLVYLVFFVVVAIAVMIVRFKHIKSDEKELKIYSQEFWTLVSAIILCLAGFQIINGTSMPVYSKIGEAFGFVVSLAPMSPKDYSAFQMWFMLAIVLVSGVGQYFWWKKIAVEKPQWGVFTIPLVITLVLSSAIIIYSQETNFGYMSLVVGGILAIVLNGNILIKLFKTNYKLSGGALAHIGVALMLLGVLYSAGYSKVVSLNTTGLVLTTNPDAPKDFNKDNQLLWLDEPTQMSDYQLTYKGIYIEADKFPDYIKQSDVVYSVDKYKMVALKNIDFDGKTYFKKGDTMRTVPENIYYRVEYRQKNGKIFSLYPRVQDNSEMGQSPASPDILRKWDKDLYTHVSAIYPDLSQEPDWSKTEEFTVAEKDTFFLNDFVAICEAIEPVKKGEIMQLTSNEVAVRAKIKIYAKNQRQYVLNPTFILRQSDGMVARPPDILPELGVKITFLNIDTEKRKFTFGVNTRQKDYIVMSATEKPLINLLWIGSLVVVAGFILAIKRRFYEFKKLGDKDTETT